MASMLPTQAKLRQTRTVMSTCAVQLKNAPNFTKVKVNAPVYKGSGGIEPSEERSQKQEKAAHSYAEVGSRPHCSSCSVADHANAECVNCCSDH